MKTLETILTIITKALLGITFSAILSMIVGILLSATIEGLAGYCHEYVCFQFALSVFPLFSFLSFMTLNDSDL